MIEPKIIAIVITAEINKTIFSTLPNALIKVLDSSMYWMVSKIRNTLNTRSTLTTVK